MGNESLRDYFQRISAIELPEIEAFFLNWFTPEFENPHGVTTLWASRNFRSEILDKFPRSRTIVSAECLYYGILIRDLPSRLDEHLGPINLAQFYEFLKRQPKGEEGTLITSGWWNEARIRENLSHTATARFKRLASKKSRFTMDETPTGTGWLYDTSPCEVTKVFQHGRLLIWSRPQ